MRMLLIFIKIEVITLKTWITLAFSFSNVGKVVEMLLLMERIAYFLNIYSNFFQVLFK